VDARKAWERDAKMDEDVLEELESGETLDTEAGGEGFLDRAINGG